MRVDARVLSSLCRAVKAFVPIFLVSTLVTAGEPLFGHRSSNRTASFHDLDPRYADSKGEFDFTLRKFSLEETSHECWGKGYHQRICKFSNLVMWNDSFYYITTEDSILADGLPEIPMSWVQIPFAIKMRFSEGSTAYMMRPEQLPFNFSQTPVLEMEEAVLWHLTYHDNFGHLLGEHGPTLHNNLCTHFGRCTFSNKDRNVHVLLPHNEDDMMAVVPPGAREMFQCFTKHPMRQTNELIFKGRLVVIRSALVGIGPTCRGFPWCRPNYGRSPLATQAILSWRARIMSCLGLPRKANVYAADRPNLVIVNRPATVGRGFLNINYMVQSLRRAFPVLDVSVHELDGKPLAAQALVYHNASIVIQAHGAALGNMVFLPRGASIIDVSPANHEDKVSWAFFMAADYKALHINPIKLPPQRAVPMLHKLKAYEEWQKLTPEWRKRIMQYGVCPRDDQIDSQFSSNIWCKFYWILKHSNILVHPVDIASAVMAAVKHMKGLSEDVDKLDKSPSRLFAVT